MSDNSYLLPVVLPEGSSVEVGLTVVVPIGTNFPCRGIATGWGKKGKRKKKKKKKIAQRNAHLRTHKLSRITSGK